MNFLMRLLKSRVKVDDNEEPTINRIDFEHSLRDQTGGGVNRIRTPTAMTLFTAFGRIFPDLVLGLENCQSLFDRIPGLNQDNFEDVRKHLIPFYERLSNVVDLLFGYSLPRKIDFYIVDGHGSYTGAKIAIESGKRILKIAKAISSYYDSIQSDWKEYVKGAQEIVVLTHKSGSDHRIAEIEAELRSRFEAKYNYGTDTFNFFGQINRLTHELSTLLQTIIRI